MRATVSTTQQHNILTCLDGLLGHATRWTDDLRFDERHRWHQHLTTLYATIIELSSNLSTLAKARSSAGVPILLRAILEAYVDLSNLAGDRKYGRHLRAAELSDWITIAKASTATNPYLASIGTRSKTRQSLKQWEEELRCLAGKNIKPLRPPAKFGRANLGQLYESYYRMLCWDAHSTFPALASRHIEADAERNTCHIIMFRRADISAHLDMCCSILIAATDEIHEVLQHPIPDGIKKLRSHLEATRMIRRPNEGHGENKEK